MKTPAIFTFKSIMSLFLIVVINNSVFGQEGLQARSKSPFWEKVRFGGGLGLGFGSGYTNIMLAPSAIYQFNNYVSAGVSLNGSYVNDRKYTTAIPEYQSWIYGGSLIALFQPIPQLQLSVEPEILRVNAKMETYDRLTFNDDFWSTGLFIGAGFRTNNVTIGVRYNVLHDSDKNVYADALMPFVRVYF